MPTVKSPSPSVARRPRTALACGLAALALAALLALSGCAATTIDVYAVTSQIEYDAAGAALETTSYDLDEKGNPVGGTTTVEDAAADGIAALGSAWTASYDMYGVPTAPWPLEGEGTYEAEYDDHGQPTRIVYRDAAGEVVLTQTFTYSEVAGHMTSETYESADISYTTTYDPQDGWPLTGSVTVGGATVDVEFVYEITEEGGVTAQHVAVSGEDVALYSYEYEEYDGNLEVSRRTNPDGTATSYTYELVEDPSPYAMARALVHPVDYGALLPYLGLA